MISEEVVGKTILNGYVYRCWVKWGGIEILLNLCPCAGIVYLEKALLHSVRMSYQRLWWVEMTSRAQEKWFLFHNDSRKVDSKI